MPAMMPSIRSVTSFALSSAQIVFLSGGNGALGGTPKSCPVDGSSPLSCQNTTVVPPSCCFNAPGGQFLLTQFWDANPPTGPIDSWTVHGLWPDKCDGTYEQYCDKNREYTNVTDIIKQAGETELLDYMNTYWKDYQGNDESFWEHEWDKHGTCINTLDPECYADYQPQEEVVAYFVKTVELFKTLNSYKFLSDAGITPSTSKKYTSAEILAALKKPRGVDVSIQCRDGALDEIWYFYNVQGSVPTGKFVPANPDGSKSSCPATGVSYLPKSGKPPSPNPTTTGGGSQPTSSPDNPFSGKGYLNVSPSAGGTKGCLISNGKWFVGGTCATYTATASGEGFTLSSSKGPCAMVGGSFSCAAGQTAGTFTSVGGKLATEGNAKFFAASVPSGSTQVAVQTASASQEISIGWKSV